MPGSQSKERKQLSILKCATNTEANLPVQQNLTVNPPKIYLCLQNLILEALCQAIHKTCVTSDLLVPQFTPVEGLKQKSLLFCSWVKTIDASF